MKSADYPALFRSADAASEQWQKVFYASQGVQVVALLCAAIGGATAWQVGSGSDAFQVSALLTILSLLTALACRLFVALKHPERLWYDARAGAESAKTLAWKYISGADPFEDSLGSDVADSEFCSRLSEILETIPSLDEPAGEDGVQITETMRTLRRQSLAARMDLYKKDRLREQKKWYSDKSRENKKSAMRWDVGLIGAELVGIVLAVLRFNDTYSIDWAGVTAAAATGGIAWLQARQHEMLARSYAIASQELAAAESDMASITTNSDWSEFVLRAETAISREHSLWKASRR